MSEQTVREPVQWFAEQMEQQLKANDHKGGWEHEQFRYLYQRLYEEWHEIWQAYNQPNRAQRDWQLIIKEAADVANFAMMIADNARKHIEDSTE